MLGWSFFGVGTEVKSVDWRAIAELVGLAAIVASLVFVGMQLELDRQVALGSQYAARAESVKADVRARMESDAFVAMQAKLWAAGTRPTWWNPEVAQLAKELELSGADLKMMESDRFLTLLQADNLYFQFQQGLLEEGYWIGARRYLKQSMEKDPFARAIFPALGQRIHPIVLELISEIESEA